MSLAYGFREDTMDEPAFGADMPQAASLVDELFSGLWVISSHREEGALCYYLAERSREDEAQRARLTPREREVLTRALLGESNKSIAISLGVCRSSVTTLLARARRKLADRVPENVLRSLLSHSHASTDVKIERAPHRE